MKLKGVLIIGPYLDVLPAIKDLMSEEEYLVIGDGERSLSLEEITDSLRGRIDSNTRIDINGHGLIDSENGSHQIALRQDDEQNNMIPTKELFATLASISTDPLQIHLWSCFGGAAAKDVDALPTGSVVTAHASPEASILSDLADTIMVAAIERNNQSISNYQIIPDITNHLLEYAQQDMFVGIKLNNTDTEILKLRIPDHDFLLKESVQRYFTEMWHIKITDKYNTWLDEGKLPSNLSAQAVNITPDLNDAFSTEKLVNFQILHGIYLLCTADERAEQDTLNDYLINVVFKELIDDNIEHYGGLFLYAAVLSGNIELVQELIAKGVNIHSTNAMNESILFYAVATNNIEIVKYLVDNHIDINHVNFNKVSPLMVAIHTENKEIAKYLINQGADLYQEDKDGKSSIALLEQASWNDLIENTSEKTDMLKGVLIIGPQLNVSSHIKLLMSKKGYIIIGDGKNELSEEEIINNLKGRIDKNTRIDVYGHGDAVDGNHFIHITKGSGEENNSSSRTSRIFELVSTATSDPLQIHLWSCYGGAAAKDISILPPGSVIAAHAPKDSSALADIQNYAAESTIANQQKNKTNSIIKELSENLLTYAQEDLYVGIKLKSGSSEVIKLKLPLQILHNPDSITKYFSKIWYQELRDKFLGWEHQGELTENLSSDDIPDISNFSGIFSEDDIREFQLANAIFTMDTGEERNDQHLISAAGNQTIAGDFYTQTSNSGIPMLHAAASAGNTQLISTILAKNIDINLLGELPQQTPLMSAAYRGKVDSMQYLIAHGADINYKTPGGVFALYLAVLSESKAAVELLLDNGANINETHGENITALHEAIDIENDTIVNLLLDRGASLTIGIPPLLTAIKVGRLDYVKLLLEHKADINAAFDYSYHAPCPTPLIEAITQDKNDIAKYLLKHGADLESKNQDGITAKQLLIDKGWANLLDSTNEITQIQELEQMALKGDDNAIKSLKEYVPNSIEGETYFANLLLHGIVVERDYNKAFELYQHAAQNGDENAQLISSCMLTQGLVTNANTELAAHWFNSTIAEQELSCDNLLGVIKTITPH